MGPDEKGPIQGGSMAQAKIITILISRTDNGLFRATSEDVRGLHAVADDDETLRSRVCNMLVDIFAAKGEDVAVYETEPRGDQTPPPWVIIPQNSVVAAC